MKRRCWPRVTLLIITDRDQYLEQMWASVQRNLDYPWYEIVIADDSDDLDHKRRADNLIDPDCIVTPGPTKMGGAAAVRSAWEYLRETDCDYVFHLEEDFVFPEPVDVRSMIAVLRSDPTLVNVVLRRQPAFNEGADGPMEGLWDQQNGYVRHQRGFWLNPSIYPKAVTERDWPEHGHESHFSEEWITHGHQFAFYGGVTDPPRCWHIGEERSPSWTW